ncbi:MAG: prepilin-type N-terminal cleavage/methylation domain-containing protein [Candidatus Aminicenantes bacterium]|nr:MAG: prepilin-type N-terminal cleavage/methylation domain-containing protein [Candidatus Aminicenantes bacterium]
MKKGFTLVEIIIVLVLIGILVSVITPIYKNSVLRAREAVLKENLFQVRDAISKYYQDKQKYPTTLEDLVTHKYLRKIPLDPILNSDEWELVRFEPEEMEDFDPEIAEGIIDVRSRSQDTALDGTPYSEW